MITTSNYSFDGAQIIVVNEKSGRKLLKQLPHVSDMFKHFTKEEALHFIERHTYEHEYGHSLNSPFSGDHTGGVGDCIVF